jgi:hypothetical protein
MERNIHTIYPGTHSSIDKIIQDLLEQLGQLCLRDGSESSGEKNNVDYTGNSYSNIEDSQEELGRLGKSPPWGGKGGVYVFTLDNIYIYIYDLGKVSSVRKEEKEERKNKQKEKETAYQIIPAADEVFAHWKSVLNHPKAKFDRKRKKLIVDALKLFEVAELKKAIDGCRLSEFHMGENDRDAIYDAISVIFGKGAEQIEKFIDLAEGGGGVYRPPYEQ